MGPRRPIPSAGRHLPARRTRSHHGGRLLLLKSNRAPYLRREIRQNSLACFDKISASARTKNGAEAAICPPRARGACPARGQSPPVAKDARRRLKTRFNYFGGEPNIDESRKARENAAERKRSRSEADTGRRIGLCFGLCLFFGREKRSRFSRCAGSSLGLRFGLWVGLNCWPSFGLYFRAESE